MRDRPIIFSRPMVHALLADRKGQTRRILGQGEDIGIAMAENPPRFDVGDQLWVRERAWFDREIIPAIGALRCFFEGGLVRFSDGRVGEAPGHPDTHTAEMFALNGSLRLRPSIHMPRWASRLTLNVTDVRVQRLNEITDEDALAEGVVFDDRRGFIVPGVEHPNKDFPYLSRSTAREMYAALWDVIHGSGEWLKNPWVVAVTFSTEKRNIGPKETAA